MKYSRPFIGVTLETEKLPDEAERCNPEQWTSSHEV